MYFFNKKFYMFLLSPIIPCFFVLNLLFAAPFVFGEGPSPVQQTRYTNPFASSFSFYSSNSSRSSANDDISHLDNGEIPQEVKKSKDSIWNIGYLVAGGIIKDEGAGFFIGPMDLKRSNIFLTDFHVVFSILQNNDDIKSIRLSQRDKPELLKIKHIQAVSSRLVLMETEKAVSNFLKVRESPLEAPDSFFVPGAYLAKNSLQDIRRRGQDSDDFFYASYSVLSGLIGSPVLDRKGEVNAVFLSGSGNTLSALYPGYLHEFITENIDKNINCKDFSCIARELESLKKIADVDLNMGQNINCRDSNCIAREEDNLNKKTAAAQFQWAYILANYMNDVQGAFQYMSSSAEKGDVLAEFYLSGMYYRGHGIAKNQEEASKLLLSAAEKGLAQAQNRFAYLSYNKGDFKQAVKWWSIAGEEQGLAEALYNLADMYAEGEEVPQDEKKAFELILLAAKKGLAQAQLMLASYGAGNGNVDLDSNEALKWERMALKN